MNIGEKEAAAIRDRLHNLDINDPEDKKVYYTNLCRILSGGEGKKLKAYNDVHGNKTIGYGFNMDRGQSARDEWNSLLKDSVSFDDAYKGKTELTEDQAVELKKHSITIREKEIARVYRPYWNKMRPNERAVATDLYYQGPALANRKSQFAKNIKEYYRTNDSQYLDKAIYEVRHRSSYSKEQGAIVGLQNRNDIRAKILDSKKSNLYSKPYDKLIPEDQQIQLAGQFIMSPENCTKKAEK